MSIYSAHFCPILITFPQIRSYSLIPAEPKRGSPPFCPPATTICGAFRRPLRSPGRSPVPRSEELAQLCSTELGSNSFPSSRAHSGTSLRHILDQNRASHEIPADQPRRGSADSLSGGTAVGSPRITSKLLADQYVPPAFSLKSRARSNSRSESPRVKVTGGWL